MPPTDRSQNGWGWYIIEPAPPGDDRVPSPVQGSFHIPNDYKTGEENRVLSGRQPPHGVETPITLARIADWFELHGGPPP